MRFYAFCHFIPQLWCLRIFTHYPSWLSTKRFNHVKPSTVQPFFLCYPKLTVTSHSILWGTYGFNTSGLYTYSPGFNQPWPPHLYRKMIHFFVIFQNLLNLIVLNSLPSIDWFFVICVIGWLVDYLRVIDSFILFGLRRLESRPTACIYLESVERGCFWITCQFSCKFVIMCV